MQRRAPQPIVPKERFCFFCQRQIDEIDYKDAQLLRRFMTSYAKIAPRRRSGVCATHQRALSNAIKRARIMAIVPFTRR